VQGTAEQGAFARSDLDELLDLATAGMAKLSAFQEQALGAPAAE
jgi:ribonuclease PH